MKTRTVAATTAPSFSRGSTRCSRVGAARYWPMVMSLTAIVRPLVPGHGTRQRARVGGVVDGQSGAQELARQRTPLGELHAERGEVRVAREELRPGLEPQEPPLGYQAEHGRERPDVRQLVGDDYYGGAALVPVARQSFLEAAPPLVVETDERLVEDEHLRVQRQDARERRPPLFAARQRERRPAAELLQGKADQGGGLTDPLLELVPFEAVVPGAESDVPGNRVREELVLRVLEEEAGLAPEIP